MMHLVHRVPGRLRFKVPSLRGDTTAGEQLRAAIQNAGGESVLRVEVNPRAGSLVVQYDSRRMNAEDFLAALDDEGLLSQGRSPHGAHAGSANKGSVVYLLGAAIGHAMFGAALKTGVEKSVLGLVGKLRR